MDVERLTYLYHNISMNTDIVVYFPFKDKDELSDLLSRGHSVNVFTVVTCDKQDEIRE